MVRNTAALLNKEAINSSRIHIRSILALRILSNIHILSNLTPTSSLVCIIRMHMHPLIHNRLNLRTITLNQYREEKSAD